MRRAMTDIRVPRGRACPDDDPVTVAAAPAGGIPPAPPAAVVPVLTMPCLLESQGRSPDWHDRCHGYYWRFEKDATGRAYDVPVRCQCRHHSLISLPPPRDRGGPHPHLFPER